MTNPRKLIWAACLSILVFSGFKILDNRFEVSKNLEIFAAVYKEVDLSYVDETKPGELMRKSIDAMLNSLDPYTVFYSEAQAEEALTQRTGEYGGLGIFVTKIEEHLVITDVFEGYSAEKAGVKIGDIIVRVSGKSFIGKSNADLSPVMKGAKGSILSIELDRPGVGIIKKEIERVEVKLKNVPFFGMVNNETGYIHLTNFMQSAAKEVSTAIIDLKKKGAKSLVLDLRNNPGGLLLEARDIVNLFIPKNELVVFTKGRTEKDYFEYKTVNKPLDLTIPLVVLVNERSASASEIVSGTLQDLDRAVVVGVNSFGKGLVQSTRSLPYRSQMKLTTAKYYTPSGRCIQALDYGNRNSDGSVGKVADSLRQAFKTKGGRTVFDGGGILPDEIVDFNENQQIIKELRNKQIIFDYAVKYLSNKSIEIGSDFTLPAAQFDEFTLFAQSLFHRIKTKTDIHIEHLNQSIKDDHINNTAEGIKALTNASIKHKTNQIKANKSEILDLLSLEIIRVYGLQSLYYKGQFNKDKTTQKAVEILQNKASYQNYLN
jgi:carboxyl-terminal processing protease